MGGTTEHNVAQARFNGKIALMTARGYDSKGLEDQLDGNLRRLQQQNDPSNWKLRDLTALLKVARALSDKATDAERVKDVLEVAVKDHDDDERQRQVARLWFGLDPSTRKRSTSTERHHAAHKYSTEYREEHGLPEEVGFNTYRTKRLGPVFFPAIAHALFERYAEWEASASSEPSSAADAPTSVSAAKTTRYPAKVLLPAMLASVGLVLAAVWAVTGLSRPPIDTPSLTELAREANRPLGKRLTPAPSTVSATLGFGDAAGGRPVYPYDEKGFATREPRLNSYVDMPSGPLAGRGDERKFLGVKAMPLDRYEKDGWRRSAFIPQNKRVAVYVYVNNSGPVQPDCSSWTNVEDLATDVRLRLAVWRASKGTLHVIRAWVSSDSTKPRWITDAVAVRTEASTGLSFDPKASWQYTDLPVGLRDRPALSTKVMKPGGMMVGHGWIGGCFANRVYLIAFFNQKK